MEDIAASEERATLTFWIPERIDAVLSEHERCTGLSRSACVRAIVRQYLYGLCGGPSPLRAGRHAGPRKNMRGGWGGRTPELGKNVVEVKLSLPLSWRDELVHSAAEAGITLSHYAREIVVTHVFGHAYLPTRVVHLRTPPAEQD